MCHHDITTRDVVCQNIFVTCRREKTSCVKSFVRNPRGKSFDFSGIFHFCDKDNWPIRNYSAGHVIQNYTKRSIAKNTQSPVKRDNNTWRSRTSLRWSCLCLVYKNPCVSLLISRGREINLIKHNVSNLIFQFNLTFYKNSWRFGDYLCLKLGK